MVIPRDAAIANDVFLPDAPAIFTPAASPTIKHSSTVNCDSTTTNFMESELIIVLRFLGLLQ